MRKEYDFKGAKRGAIVRPPPGKTRITIRLDDDVLEWFRNRTDSAGGGSYQAMINATLRTLMQEGQANIEHLLRRVLREELKRSKGSSHGRSKAA